MDAVGAENSTIGERRSAVGDGLGDYIERMAPAEVVRAVDLYREVRKLADPLAVDVDAAVGARLLLAVAAQEHRAQLTRDAVLRALESDPYIIAAVSPDTLEHARRVAATRSRLLASGSWTVTQLADVRGDSKGSVRTWISRQRRSGRLFTVTVRGETRVPALVLDEGAEPIPGLERVLGPLQAIGMQPWSLWVWLDTPSPWLDGRRPADLLVPGEIELVAHAAAAQAGNPAAA